MLGVVMRRAYSRGYRGPGHLWGSLAPEQLAEILANGEHVPVLRSMDFCMSFWVKRRLFEVPGTGGDTVEGIVGDLEWEVHQRALEKHPDPLAYAIEHMDDAK